MRSSCTHLHPNAFDKDTNYFHTIQECYSSCFLYTESSVFPSLSFHKIHPFEDRPMQKSEAVLGLEKVLSESIVQTPLSKVAYSRTIFPVFFPGERRRAIIGNHTPCKHRKAGRIIESFCIASTTFGKEQMLLLGSGYFEDITAYKRCQELDVLKNSSMASR